MLHWRLLIGIPLVAILAGMCYVDTIAPAPGVVLMPFFLVCLFFLCKEILTLLNAGGIYPRRTTIYLGVFVTILLCWASCYNSLPLIARLERSFVEAIQETYELKEQDKDRQNAADGSADVQKERKTADENGESSPVELATSAVATAKDALEKAERALTVAQEQERIKSQINEDESAFVPLQSLANEREWKTAAFACVHTLLAIAFGVLIAFVGEMLRFKLPGGHLINLSGAVFAIVYIGLLGSFMVMLRIAYGVTAVVSLIVVTKMCDVGAYTVGRLIGRHKMAPSLSPGKTIEGFVGGLTFAILAAWFSTGILFPLATGESSKTSWIGVVAYGLTVGCAGALGDLAESLIKRDVMRKDSGTNVPGFGGFLDIFDSLLLAAPVAFGLWAFHVIR